MVWNTVEKRIKEAKGGDTIKNKLTNMKYCQEVKQSEDTGNKGQNIWMFDNIGETTEKLLIELLTMHGGKVIETKKMEKGGLQ